MRMSRHVCSKRRFWQRLAIAHIVTKRSLPETTRARHISNALPLSVLPYIPNSWFCRQSIVKYRVVWLPQVKTLRHERVKRNDPDLITNDDSAGITSDYSRLGLATWSFLRLLPGLREDKTPTLGGLLWIQRRPGSNKPNRTQLCSSGGSCAQRCPRRAKWSSR